MLLEQQYWAGSLNNALNKYISDFYSFLNFMSLIFTYGNYTLTPPCLNSQWIYDSLTKKYFLLQSEPKHFSNSMLQKNSLVTCCFSSYFLNRKTNEDACAIIIIYNGILSKQNRESRDFVGMFTVPYKDKQKVDIVLIGNTFSNK